jgi:hypothetical protein
MGEESGSWGTIDANGDFHEVTRIDVGEPGQPGFRGKTHMHITDQSGHLPPTIRPGISESVQAGTI